MLKKLIGYEFQATRRIFIPSLLIVLVLSVVNAVSLLFTGQKITLPIGILMTAYVLSIMAVCILAFVYMIQRFYKNLLGDEGYLMFTLPARPSQLIWSKCIVSTIWFLITGIVCMISFGVLMLSMIQTSNSPLTISMFFEGLRFVWSEFTQEFGLLTVTLAPIEGILIGIVMIVHSILHIYACLSIGSLAGKHRLLVAFLAYLGFSIVTEIGVMLFAGVGYFFQTPLHWIESLGEPIQFQLLMIGTLLVQVICVAVNFIITNYILSKKLNLE